MKNFVTPHDLIDVKSIVNEAIRLKNSSEDQSQIGKGKTMILLFFNASLRTRISSQIAAEKLGMKVLSLDMSATWNLEYEEGTIMRFDTAEHIKDAAAVLSMYGDIIGVRAFARLENKEEDYSDKLINAFHEYCTIPVVNLESSIRHPLQSLADMITIEETVVSPNPKIVLSWAPHPRALPHAVVNSFLEWSHLCDHEVTVTYPQGYELDTNFIKGHKIELNQNRALEGADFIYVKNWSASVDYGKVLSQDASWMIDEEKMSKTNNGKFMHCMPIRRNVVATDGVLDGSQSLMYHQAQNRLHSAIYVIKSLLENE